MPMFHRFILRKKKTNVFWYPCLNPSTHSSSHSEFSHSHHSTATKEILAMQLSVITSSHCRFAETKEILSCTPFTPSKISFLIIKRIPHHARNEPHISRHFIEIRSRASLNLCPGISRCSQMPSFKLSSQDSKLGSCCLMALREEQASCSRPSSLSSSYPAHS
jgi:hypothetical protein